MPVLSGRSGGRRDDLVQPFLIDDSGLRGRLIRLGPAVDAVLTRHAYPPAVAALLAEALALTAALAATLKYEGVFTLQTKGDGPVRMMVADCTSGGAMRGYAEVKGPAPDPADVGGAPVPRLFGAGYLAFTVDQGEHAERYQGIVDLQGATLADCVHHYFRQSDQFSAGLKTASARGPAGGWRAGALMLQRLPADELAIDREDREDAWRRAMILMGSCTDRELVDGDLPPNDLLYRLFHEDGVRVFEPRPLRFACRCSRGRVAAILASLTKAELEDCKIDGRIEVVCQFCNSAERFDQDDLGGLRKSKAG